MRAVKSRDTHPEMVVRRLLHSLGYRFRLHRKDLPGKPDIVFPGRGKLILIHGCFWHGHDCARGARVPKANREYWLRKVSGNQERDARHLADLMAAGWGVRVVWECETKTLTSLTPELTRFLNP